jgi:hypothetical protein
MGVGITQLKLQEIHQLVFMVQNISDMFRSSDARGVDR